MKKILIKIAYDGTNYNGWQSGKTGIGIENVISKAISKLLDDDIKIFGVSRTDAGVHALNNVAVFETNRKVNPDKIYFAINGLLPNDIVINDSYEVPIDFNPRKAVSKKIYTYHIYNAKIPNPLKDRYSHFVYYNIDIKKMINASKYLIGEHDFKSFANPESQILINGGSSVRTIYDINIEKDNDNMILLTFVGNGFLYHMVRILAGTLLKIGMGMIDENQIVEIINKKDRRYAGFTLPAKGLVLKDIIFENDK